MGNHYTAERFINAIPGTGGIIKVLADRVGCDWHTARKYTREYATVAQAWEAERNSITDKARHNIVKAITKGDLQMSKWWLQTMDEDFVPRLKQEVTGANGGPIETRNVGIDATQRDRALSALANAITDSIHPDSRESGGAVGSAKRATVASVPESG